MARTHARRVLLGAGLVIVALAIAGAVGWSQRRAAVRWWALRELAELGIVASSVEIGRFDASRLELRGLRAGDNGELTIAEVDAEFSLGDLRRGRVRSLRISGIRLVGEIGADGVNLGGLEGAGGASQDAEIAGLRLPVLPTNELVIEDARAEVATPQGPLTGELSVRAHDTAGRIEARGDLVVRHALAEATAQLELAGADDAFGGVAAIGARLLPGAELGLPFSAGTLALAAEIAVQGEELRASLAPGPFTLVRGKGKRALRIEGTTPNATLLAPLGGAGGALRIEASGGDLRIPTLALTARGFEIEATLGEALRELTARLHVREIADMQRPARAAPLALDASVAPRKQALGFELHARDVKRRFALHAQGDLDPETWAADAELRLDPVTFAKDGLQPGQLLPAAGEYVFAASGSVEATGRARLGARAPKLTLDLAARNFAFETPLAQVEAVNGTLRVLGPPPLSTPPGQLVSIGRIGFGLDLVNGLVTAQLRRDGVLVIESAEWQTLGGRVSTAGNVDPQATQQAIVLEAQDLDLAQLLALVNLEGLSGEGRLDGTLPVTRSSDAITIRGGLLRARPGGWLRYQPAPGVAGLRESGPGFGLLLGAFENLRFDVLELKLDGVTNGLMQLGLRVEGVNADFQDGRPIHYNLNVESRLADLLRQSVAIYRIPQVIEERLQHFGEKPK